MLEEENLARFVGAEVSQITDYGCSGANDAKESDIYVSGATRTTRAVLNAVRAVAYAWNTRSAEGAL